MDLNYKPYKELGNRNGYASITWGACGSRLEELAINITSDRASDLVAPFLKDGELCKGDAMKQASTPALPGKDCASVSSRGLCEEAEGCAWCQVSDPVSSLQTGCFDFEEAGVLSHVLNTERGPGAFMCANDLASQSQEKSIEFVKNKNPEDTCTGPHESCCPAPGDDPNNCPASARTSDCDAKKSCCCG